MQLMLIYLSLKSLSTDFNIFLNIISLLLIIFSHSLEGMCHSFWSSLLLCSTNKKEVSKAINTRRTSTLGKISYHTAHSLHRHSEWGRQMKQELLLYNRGGNAWLCKPYTHREHRVIMFRDILKKYKLLVEVSKSLYLKYTQHCRSWEWKRTKHLFL